MPRLPSPAMRGVLALALAAFTAAQTAAAAQPACLTAGEFTALSTYSLPSVIRGISERCTAALPADAYLRHDGEALAARYEHGKNTAWPGAKAAFIKLGAGLDPQVAQVIAAMPEQNLRSMVDEFIKGAIGQQLPDARCHTVNRVVELLSPLPAQSAAELIALAAGLAANDGRAHVGKIAICPR